MMPNRRITDPDYRLPPYTNDDEQSPQPPTKAGRRVELMRCNDPHTRLRPGDRGTVQLVDSLGTVHVKWDNGERLGLVWAAGDRWWPI